MARFEVFIPPAEKDGLSLTLRVSADSWMEALKIGLRKIGEGGQLPQNVLCDVQEDESIHVTDPRTSRVFRIAELVEARPPPPPPPEPPPAPPPQTRGKPEPKKVEPKAKPPPKTEPPPPTPHVDRPRDGLEDALVELFERAPAAFGKPLEEALYYLLDLALEKIPADAGTVYVADLNRRDLHFAAARGPKAAELLKLGITVPMGKGFVGFCAQEGVGIAVSDAQRDPRHFKEVSEKLGYAISSVITTPFLAHGRTLGAIQLLNRKGSSSFSSAELSMLHYVAHQAAIYLEASGA